MTRYIFDHWEVDGVNVGSFNPAVIGPIRSDVVIKAVYREEGVPPPPPVSMELVAGAVIVSVCVVAAIVYAVVTR